MLCQAGRLPQGGYVPGTKACPAFACSSGAHILADYPLSYEATLRSVVTACRNAICFDLRLWGSAQPPMAGGTVGLFSNDALQSRPDGTDIGLTRDLLGRLYLDFRWRPSRPQDGDRYSAKVVDGSGMTYLLLDHQIQYRDTSIGRPGAPCFQDCKLAEVDLRQGAP